MPTIDFHGKKAIQNYEPPYHILEEVLELNYQSPKEGNSSDNILIEGDNLLALKSLLPEYEGKIKCIYIDPPYNTNNKDWVYCDNIEITSKNDPAWQQVEKFLKDGNEIDYNDPSRHSKWLCMMYPRLKLLHKLLKDDGVIFVSIDDNEVHHLRMIMDEIWGEQNFVGEFIKQSKVGGGSDSKHLVKEHEYVLIYTKNLSILPELFIDHKEDYLRRYKEVDEKGRYFWDTFARPGLKNPIKYDVIAPNREAISGEWIRSKERYLKDLENGEIRFVKKSDGKWSVQFKQYLNESGKKPRSMTMDFGGTIEGKMSLKEIFNRDKFFDYPKSPKFISILLNLVTTKDDIILDSFAGSGTTAHAVLALNKEDGGNRRFITVQLPEKIKEDKPAYQAGYKYVHEITKARIEKVAGGYTNSKGESVEGLGGGFKYYRVGTPLFTKDGSDIISSVTWEQLAPYLFYTEFKKAYVREEVASKPKVGSSNDTGLYLIYSEPQNNIFDYGIYKEIMKDKSGRKIVYADKYQGIDEEELQRAGIEFKQIPYDIFGCNN
jgi:adenine-specific DNA-methyltransferase